MYRRSLRGPWPPGGARDRPLVWTCQAAGGRNEMPRKSQAERNFRARARPCFASKAHRHLFRRKQNCGLQNKHEAQNHQLRGGGGGGRRYSAFRTGHASNCGAKGTCGRRGNVHPKVPCSRGGVFTSCREKSPKGRSQSRSRELSPPEGHRWT